MTISTHIKLSFQKLLPTIFSRFLLHFFSWVSLWWKMRSLSIYKRLFLKCQKNSKSKENHYNLFSILSKSILFLMFSNLKKTNNSLFNCLFKLTSSFHSKIYFWQSFSRFLLNFFSWVSHWRKIRSFKNCLRLFHKRQKISPSQ